MSTKIWLSTHKAPVDPHEATLSVFDRGFLYGDSVYETLRSVGPLHVADLQAHLDRLQRSGQGLGIEAMPAAATVRQAMRATLVAAQNPQARIRVVVTRGTGPLSIDTRTSSDPLLVVFVQEIGLPSDQAYAQGISACIIRADASQAGKAGLKTGNYLPNIMALRGAIERQGQDAILCNGEGDITEAATSNVFLVDQGALYTPDLAAGLLPGITRSKVIALARARGLQVHECRIRPEQLVRAQELFLTSSVRGLMPVTTLDGEPVGQGRPGPVTTALHEAYDQALLEAAQREPDNLQTPGI